MHPSRGLLWLLASLMCACGGNGAPTTPSPTATTTTSVPATVAGVLDVAVLVDSQAPQTPGAAIERVFSRAVAKLEEKTGERARITEIVHGFARAGDARSTAMSYVTSRSGSPPEAIVVLTNDTTAHTFGGYSQYFQPSVAFRNEYPSPRPEVGSDKIYVVALEFDHPYARCGYDENGNHVSDVSIDGECRNRPGTPCVQRGDRFMCADATNDLYAEDDYFTGCTIVHEFMHPFGIDSNPNLDHYGTSPCRARTGMTAAEAADLRQAQLNCGMCPDVYQRFRRAP